MDLKVYEKEEVLQPHGTENVYVPNVIDLIPEIKIGESGEEILTNAVTLDKDSEVLEQMCGLATIWQRGLDPLDLEDGVRWSEALLEEINAIQLMEDIRNAVAEITPNVVVEFDTVTADNGQSYLKYTLKVVA
jgi:hypothetical protein